MLASRVWYFQVTGFGPVGHSLAWCISGRKLGTSCSKPQLLDEIYTPGFSGAGSRKLMTWLFYLAFAQVSSSPYVFFSVLYPSLWELHEPPARPIILTTPLPRPTSRSRNSAKGSQAPKNGSYPRGPLQRCLTQAGRTQGGLQAPGREGATC